MGNILISSYLIETLMLLMSLTPFFIYLRYGRKQKIDYNAEYEMDLPTDDPPAIVNAICTGDPRDGLPDMRGFDATILDLIDRNYLFLKNKDHNESSHLEFLLLEINPKNNSSTLWDFELEILNAIEKYGENGIISINILYNVTYLTWRGLVKDALMDGNNFSGAFYGKGDKYLKNFGFLATITVWALIFYAFPAKLFSTTYIICAVILLIASFISFVYSKKIVFQCTPYGREYYKRWMNFKKYIGDFSLMNEYPLESLKIWNRYLVYATALGIAEGAENQLWRYQTILNGSKSD